AAAAALALHDAERLLRQFDIAAALSLEGLLALTEPFRPALHAANRQPGQVQVAANLRRLLAGSRLVDAAPERVQDAYSVRCIPQVTGPARDCLAFLRGRITDALNAADDNPLVFVNADTGAVESQSGGN